MAHELITSELPLASGRPPGYMTFDTKGDVGIVPSDEHLECEKPAALLEPLSICTYLPCFQQRRDDCFMLVLPSYRHRGISTLKCGINIRFARSEK